MSTDPAKSSDANEAAHCMTADLADLSRLPEIKEQRGGDPDLLFAELKHIIAAAVTNHPRSQQKRLGPSEIGDPCARRIAYKLTDTPPARTQPTPWRPTVGTAVHAWLEETFAEHNQALRDTYGASRFLIEQRINAGPCAGADLEGSTDLYDRVTACSIDWKGLSLDTPIPTLSGWSTIAALQVGDEVFDANGKPCKVVAKSPIFERPCYTLEFEDGAQIVADNMHEWPMLVGQGFTPRLLSTEDAATKVFGYIKNPVRQLRIKNAGPIETPEANLPVPPYTFGVWLGDGAKNWGSIGCDPRDAELFQYIHEEGYETGRPHGARGFVRTAYGLYGHLRVAGLIGHKHVPDVYLRGSIAQRLALLRGLMDTDGTWNTVRNEAIFSNTNKVLSLAVAELIHSLGWKSRMHVLTKQGFGVTTTSYDIAFVPHGMNPFRLSRKANLVRLGGSTRCRRRIIKSITPTVSVPTQCIEVDSPDHTYLCGEQMIPTHNCVGPSSHKTLRADVNAGRGPRPEYRVQLHTYGLGFTLRGLPVDRVMLVALPSAGELDDAVMWTEPFDPQIARDAMTRVDRVHVLTATLGAAAFTVTNGALAVVGAGHLAEPGGNPGEPAIGTDGHGCRFCPWLKGGSTDPATGCPGVYADAAPSALHSLVG